MKKRKDNKGRALKDGESQRKDMLYQYRYTVRGKRYTIYDSDLDSLREKEDKIRKSLSEGVDYAAGDITVTELAKRYIGLKQGVRRTTKESYNFVLKTIEKDTFGCQKIRNVKVSDVKRWFIKLYEDGKASGTIKNIRTVLRPAFQIAFEEDIISKNPFDFELKGIIPNNAQKRVALTKEQQDIWMKFIKEDKTCSKYYDEFVVLLETGMRASEFCGLTKKDVDFKNRKIRVDHQLIRLKKKYHVEKTKTECGCRYIPMTDVVYESLENIIKNRKTPKQEMIIDGYVGFILIDSKEKPKTVIHLDSDLRTATERYSKLYPDKPLPNITPHICRHTFCTNMANAGMDIKTLQYIMGHSNVSITLNVYTHANYENAAKQMAEIVGFQNVKEEKVAEN